MNKTTSFFRAKLLGNTILQYWQLKTSGNVTVVLVEVRQIRVLRFP